MSAPRLIIALPALGSDELIVCADLGRDFGPALASFPRSADGEAAARTFIADRGGRP